MTTELELIIKDLKASLVAMERLEESAKEQVVEAQELPKGRLLKEWKEGYHEGVAAGYKLSRDWVKSTLRIAERLAE